MAFSDYFKNPFNLTAYKAELASEALRAEPRPHAVTFAKDMRNNSSSLATSTALATLNTLVVAGAFSPNSALTYAVCGLGAAAAFAAAVASSRQIKAARDLLTDTVVTDVAFAARRSNRTGRDMLTGLVEDHNAMVHKKIDQLPHDHKRRDVLKGKLLPLGSNLR